MEERRRFPRRPVRGDDSARVPVVQQVRIVDISAAGVLLHSARALEVGTRASLRLSLDGKPFFAEIQVQRVISNPGDASGCSVGAKFIAVSAEDRQLIERFMTQ
jgi:hypothetical protein